MKDCNKKSDDYCIDCKKCIILKYVRFGLTDFVFLPLHINHSSVSLYKKPISAGFVNISRMQTFGQSISLSLKPKKDDEDIIKSILID